MSESLAGIGLRAPHIIPIYQQKPDIGWLEVHSENYTSLGGIDFNYLLKLREKYEISLHGIGMSLGSFEEPNREHIHSIKALANLVKPFLVSEHLSWSAQGEKYLPDLLPIPYNKESLNIFSRNVEIAQEILQTNILIENPSSYFEFNNSTYSEACFLNELARRTGCRVLLDVNNIFVSSQNNGFSAEEYILEISDNIVKEIHVAGHSRKDFLNKNSLLIDSHNDVVTNHVWELLRLSLKKFGPIPTMIEWDADLPDLAVLLEEADKIKNEINKVSHS